MKTGKIKKPIAVVALFLSAFFVLPLTESCSNSDDDKATKEVVVAEGTINGQAYSSVYHVPVNTDYYDDMLNMFVKPKLIAVFFQLSPTNRQGKSYDVVFHLLPDANYKIGATKKYHVSFCNAVETQTLNKQVAEAGKTAPRGEAMTSFLLQHGVRDGVAMVREHGSKDAFQSLEGDIELTRAAGNGNVCVGSFRLKNREGTGITPYNMNCNFKTNFLQQ
jgi:hypothetical protein